MENTLVVEEKLTNKKSLQMIWLLAWPVMLGQVLQTALELVDLYFISMLRDTVFFAAIGYSTSLFGVVVVASQLVVAGTIALIARESGAENQNTVTNLTRQALTLALLVGVFLWICVSVFATPLLQLFGARGNLLLYGTNYLRIVLVGIPFVYYNMTGRAILQAKGDTFTPMIIFVLMNAVNILFNWLLIFGVWIFPELGYKGAAYGTLLSNIFAFVLFVFVLQRKAFKGKILDVITPVFDFELMIRFIKIGGYAVVQAVARPITGLFMYGIASLSGENALAAFTIGGRMFNLVFIILAGLTTAISVLTGQNLGKKDYNSINVHVKNGLLIGAINMLIFAIPYFIFSESIMGVFVKNPEDFRVIEIGVSYFRITYVGLIFVIFSVIYGGVFIGAGDTAPPMVASLVANWAVKVPLAYIFAGRLNLGSNWVWIAISLSVIVEVLIVSIWYGKGRWKFKKI
ncbi:MATE family efflux transporter [Alkalicella caledoniensis]|uniref:Probable multidrug resistance protein NorM n=1 Tax=Alkalicella caledoniensis TaxID=2731377 RepID=A0A7G9W554_ALKCA|nr:MATE family efflux transporter [Alkalicella caledoniensis]QNO13816.1 MATE family efflux transporter [Alkalicella caledoniensis]